MANKDGWNLERNHDKITLGKKQYRNMEEWCRPCAVCGEPFTIYVRASAGAVNASFGLRTCKDHRGMKPGVTGTLHGISSEEFDAVKQERDEAWEANLELLAKHKAVFDDLQVAKGEIASLRGRLAQYELPEAMAAAKNKMPWE